MKYLILFGLLTVSSPNLFAQSNVEFNYSDVYMGRNLNLVYKHQLGNWSPYAGFGYFVNRIDRIIPNVFIKKAGFAEEVKERLGLRFGTEYSIFKNEHCSVGLFYESQVYKTSAKLWSPYSSDSVNYSGMRNFGPMLSIDNLLGVAVQASLTDHFYINLKGAFGVHCLRGFGYTELDPSKFTLSVQSSFSLGLGYTFRGKFKG